MRKIIYTLFAFVFLLGLVSCGEEKKSSSSSSSDSSSSGVTALKKMKNSREHISKLYSHVIDWDWYVNSMNRTVENSYYDSAYIANNRGIDATGQKLDIDFSVESWKRDFKKLEADNLFFKSLKDKKYDYIKSCWNKLIEDFIRINSWILKNNVVADKTGSFPIGSMIQYTDEYDKAYYELSNNESGKNETQQEFENRERNEKIEKMIKEKLEL